MEATQLFSTTREMEFSLNAEPAGDGLGGRVPQIRRRLPARR
jgi:hypothetical protein